MEINNKVVANAVAAQGAATNASQRDDEVVAAYRKGCAGIAARLYAELLKLKAYVAGNEGLHRMQTDEFRRHVEAVLDSELDVVAVKGSR